MALHEGWWMLNRGDGWCMPPGTTWGTDGTWAYRDAHGLSNEEMVAHGFDDYLRSIGAVPVAEMCARVEAAEKKLADVMAKSAELYEEGKRIAHASEAIVRRAEAAEQRVAELEAREQAHIGEIEAVRMVWQDYALAPDTDLTPDAQRFKRQLREIVGIDAAEQRAEKWRGLAGGFRQLTPDIVRRLKEVMRSVADGDRDGMESHLNEAESIAEKLDALLADYDAAAKAEKEQAHE